MFASVRDGNAGAEGMADAGSSPKKKSLWLLILTYHTGKFLPDR